MCLLLLNHQPAIQNHSCMADTLAGVLFPISCGHGPGSQQLPTGAALPQWSLLPRSNRKMLVCPQNLVEAGKTWWARLLPLHWRAAERLWRKGTVSPKLSPWEECCMRVTFSALQAALPTTALSEEAAAYGVKVHSSPFAFFPRRAPHLCWSSAGHVYLIHVNTAGCRSKQLSSWLRWLPLDLLKNESQFCFRTNNHLPELLQYDLLETATALTV